jgi:predicted nuclease of predicted toxin-antitoxin system
LPAHLDAGLVDMNLSPAWVPFLRQAGFDADHWSEVGASTASDREVMQWAAIRAAVVLTADLDFSAILAAGGENGPSVVQVRADLLTPSAIGERVVRALRELRTDIEGGAIVTLDAYRARVRVLPLK